jgi:hypothetical protein
MKKFFSLIFAVFVVTTNSNVWAQDAQTNVAIEDLLAEDDDRPLTSEEIKALWKKMKSLDVEQMNAFTYDLTTNQANQLRTWLLNGRTEKEIGRWMMLLSLPVCAGIGALGRATTNETDANGNKVVPDWSYTIGMLSFPTLLIGGGILFVKGRNRYESGRLLIVETPIQQDFHLKNHYATTGLKILKDPFSNQYTMGAGLTITF